MDAEERYHLLKELHPKAKEALSRKEELKGGEYPE